MIGDELRFNENQALQRHREKWKENKPFNFQSKIGLDFSMSLASGTRDFATPMAVMASKNEQENDHFGVIIQGEMS